MTEQIRAWIDNGTINKDDLAEIEKLSKQRRESGQDYCPYKRIDKNKKPFCGFTTRRCYKEEGYIECSEFQEFYLEEVASRFEDLLPIGAPF